MLDTYEQILAAVSNQNRYVISGQLSLFGDAPEEAGVPLMQPPDVPEYPEQVLLQMEKDLTGLFLSGHPLSRWRTHCQLLRLPEIADVIRMKEHAQVMLLCMVSEARAHVTKKGDQMCYLTVEDFTGSLECLVFQSLYPQVQKLLQPDVPVFVKGKLSKKDGETKLFCDGIMSEQNFADFAASKQLCCKIPDSEPEKMKAVLEICRRFPGETPLCFWLTGSRKYLKPKMQQGTDICPNLLKCLTEHLPLSQIALIDRKG